MITKYINLPANVGQTEHPVNIRLMQKKYIYNEDIKFYGISNH